MKKLLFFWNELKNTFWFVPILIILLSILLAIGFVYTDQIAKFSRTGLGRFFFVNSIDSARSILSTISGAMIGVAGTVFSVTLVALTLASSQLGPRLIRNFMYVRLNQIVLGSYISTYLYCLIVLNSIHQNSDYTFIPSLSILVAIIAAIANIILLIVFIHQIAVSIQADKVISDVSISISKQVKLLFPDKMGDDTDAEKVLNVDAVLSKYSNIISVKCPQSGYLQYIDGESLLKMMTNSEALFELNYRPGDYLVEGIEIGKLYTNEKMEKEEVAKILFQFVIGKTKNSQQDLEFSIHQMVEIASRALSPGINDPYTAITCIDNLTATVCYLAQAKFPSKYRIDDKKELRIIADTIDFEGVLDASFNQIRQFSAGSTAVIIRLMEVLLIIHEFATKENYKKAIVKHVKMTLNVGKQSIKEENDLEDLIERSKKIMIE
ncbi:DUF2254 domain-containing protein [Sunxiuqinia sp. sy24]|uniref:DUF2254 domain-containing protein n=1 Tax=Sunxiuqinia sp. sy24 TaxID=3461495 RepID=UPI0040453BA6